MSATPRILDANANRAREALRVMEDAARFALDDAQLCRQLKSIRHELRQALAGLPQGWLEANRDVPGDVGTSFSTDDEITRAGLIDIVVAAGKRLGEALRVIEETSKTLDPDVARRIEAIRYRVYDVESALHLRMGTGRSSQWRLCVLLSESHCARPWEEVLRAAIAGGADCIQVHEKKMQGAALTIRVKRVLEIARPAAVSVIVNDHVDVALAAKADGVHLGQQDLSVRDVRRIAGRTLLVGTSTHNLAQAQAAVGAGADYGGLGAMFDTATKADAEPAGPEYLRAFVDRFPRQPHLAIGGITPDNIARLVEHGARGVAVCSAVCGVDRPQAVVIALREALEATAPLTGGTTV